MGNRKRKQRKAIRRAVRELTTFALGALVEFVTEHFGASKEARRKLNPAKYLRDEPS
jgi:hypothetical protein